MKDDFQAEVNLSVDLEVDILAIKLFQKHCVDFKKVNHFHEKSGIHSFSKLKRSNNRHVSDPLKA